MLPVIVIQQRDLIDRTVCSYLAVWMISFGFFLLYPTIAPRPAEVPGDGFAAWGLRFLYDADPPYNCFPSLHVAHSFVSALTCYRVHRKLGITAVLCAALVAISTLFAKQHYILDVVAGILLALSVFMYWSGEARAERFERGQRFLPNLNPDEIGDIAIRKGE